MRAQRPAERRPRCWAAACRCDARTGGDEVTGQAGGGALHGQLKLQLMAALAQRRAAQVDGSGKVRLSILDADGRPLTSGGAGEEAGAGTASMTPIPGASAGADADAPPSSITRSTVAPMTPDAADGGAAAAGAADALSPPADRTPAAAAAVVGGLSAAFASSGTEQGRSMHAPEADVMDVVPEGTQVRRVRWWVPWWGQRPSRCCCPVGRACRMLDTPPPRARPRRTWTRCCVPRATSPSRWTTW
jgi:hypothetical protein